MPSADNAGAPILLGYSLNQRHSLPPHLRRLFRINVHALHQVWGERIEFRALFGKPADVNKVIAGEYDAGFPAYINHFPVYVSAASFQYRKMQIPDNQLPDRKKGIVFLRRAAVHV